MKARSSSKSIRIARGVTAFMVAGALANPGYTAERRVALHGHIAPQIQKATLLGRAQSNETVQLSLAVRPDPTLLRQTLEGIYGRNAPPRRHYLSSAEFAQRFGLAEKRQVIKNFARANGLTVNSADDQAESMMVKVSGSAGAVENAFGMRLNHYRAADGKEFRANEADPMIPESLTTQLGAVIGLSNITGIYHPHLRKRALDGQFHPRLTGATGPGGTLAPADIKTIYHLNGTTLTGAGQTTAVFELDGFLPSDITKYKNDFGLPNTPITFVGVDGATNTPGAGQDEVTLDIDMVLALAPGITQLIDYDGPNNGTGILDTYDRIATDNLAKSVSSSWGAHELQSPAFDALEAQIFQRMAAQGQSFYAASGDNGGFDDGSTPSVDDPASQEFVTGVGGTSLAGSSVASPVEVAWNSCGTGQCLQGSGGSSGGGVSAITPIPNYQVGTPGLASTTMRNVPDVSLNADPNTGYAVAVNGVYFSIGGTSAAAPLWAGFTALLNQANAIAGTSTLGFANTTLYELGPSSSTYATNFVDITSGDNGVFTAQATYDNVTGLGSFRGAALIDSLTGVLSAISAQAQLEALVNVYAFPNPWDTRKYSTRRVSIANVPNDGTVKIYTLSGFWVKTLTPSNLQADWDLTNDAGDHVASGLYFYTVNTPSAKTKGTIAIIK